MAIQPLPMDVHVTSKPMAKLKHANLTIFLCCVSMMKGAAPIFANGSCSRAKPSALALPDGLILVGLLRFSRLSDVLCPENDFHRFQTIVFMTDIGSPGWQ